MPQVHRFEWRGLTGLVLRVLDDEHHILGELIEGPLPASEAGRAIRMSGSCCFVQTPNERVMIDAGLDADLVSRGLAAEGLDPDHVDLVVVTHGDQDHVRGLIRASGEVTFPNAWHVIHEDLWAAWVDGRELPRVPKERFVAALSPRIRCVHGGRCPAHGICVVDAPGHRLGHLAVEIATDGAPFLHVGDALLHPAFVRLADRRIPGEDDPGLAAATRRALLQRAATRGALVAASHFPFPGLGQIETPGGGFVWSPRPLLAD